jgi:hypothetical protein
MIYIKLSICIPLAIPVSIFRWKAIEMAQREDLGADYLGMVRWYPHDVSNRFSEIRGSGAAYYCLKFQAYNLFAVNIQVSGNCAS